MKNICKIHTSPLTVSVSFMNTINFAGQVIDKAKCPRPNEVWHTCGPNCQNECETLGQPCDIVHIKCPEGCYCEKGYARAPKTGKCIPIKNCPAEIKTPCKAL